MGKKVLVGVSLAVILALASTASFAYQDDHDKAKGGQGKSCKVTAKAHMVLKNKDELGISENQEEKIEALLLKAKKESIRQDAEIEIIGLDIKAKMKENTVNVQEINPLIDKKYDLKKAKAKASLAAYAELKNILTDKQKETLKELYEKKMCEMKEKIGEKKGQHMMMDQRQKESRR